MNIRQITIDRCIELQAASERGYRKAREAALRGNGDLAIAYQARAATDAQGARTRLDRTNGVGAIVEQRGPVVTATDPADTILGEVLDG